MKTSSKWSDLCLPWQVALEEAWLAYGAGSMPIGAVVVGPEGAIVTRGRNRIGETARDPGLMTHSKLAHAEMNALYAMPLDGPLDPRACAIYTTTEPCPLCMGAIYMLGVRRIYYASRDPHAGSTNLLGTTPYLSYKPVRAFAPDHADLETLLVALHTEFIIRRFSAAGQVVIDAGRAVLPDAVALGERLAASGETYRMAVEHMPVPQAVDWLFEQVFNGLD